MQDGTVCALRQQHQPRGVNAPAAGGERATSRHEQHVGIPTQWTPLYPDAAVSVVDRACIRCPRTRRGAAFGDFSIGVFCPTNRAK